MKDWEGIDLTSLKKSRDTTAVHMAQFIIMTILQKQGHATTNHFPRCGLAPEMI